ncbi:CpaF family protein [Myxococcota bacterium]|nr:CpaF family protein [Myxococcota bacterium]
MDIYSESLKSFLEPVWRYVEDERISEILINGPDSVWVEMKGKLYKTKSKFTANGLLAAARNMAQYCGRVITDEKPRLDARLPDGSRIHVVLPPIARCGTIVSIRKFFPGGLTIDQMVEFGSISAEMAHFVEACVLVKQNIVVSGGTGSGKTTLLNVVSTFVPNDERIITIEDSAELQLHQEHLVPLESRPPDEKGRFGVNMGDLLHSSLRLRPDRIIIGEVRGGEAFDLLQAMNTGHGGSMCTTHANTPKETLSRLESLALMSGIELPLVAVRSQVAAAIQVVVSCARFSDGSRKVTHVSEILPLNEKGDYRVQDIFIFNQTHRDENGKIHGYHTPTGIVPRLQKKLLTNGFEDMVDDFFRPESYGLVPPTYFETGN